MNIVETKKLINVHRVGDDKINIDVSRVTVFDKMRRQSTIVTPSTTLAPNVNHGIKRFYTKDTIAAQNKKS